VSSFKRLVDIARAEVGSVLEKAERVGERVTERVTGSKKPLDEFSDDELSAEIERRRLQKQHRDEEAAGKAAAEAKKAKAGPTASQTAADPGPAAAPPPRAQKIVARGIEQYYTNLEVEPGADLETIKRAYRRLMRKYHPDKHAGDPTKYKAATELAQSLTRAYMELKKHLES
jgi:DnaJ-domain-containing protein 1